jgi:DNA-binding transcriptional MerR regulator
VFRIGEFARFTRVSVKMLRHYDQLGLLPAARVDPATGYRYYDTAQLPRLNRILLLRELGFRLEEIGRLLEEEADEVYAGRERELRETVRHTQAQLRAVAARRELLRGGALPPADVVVRPVPALPVALSGAVRG